MKNKSQSNEFFTSDNTRKSLLSQKYTVDDTSFNENNFEDGDIINENRFESVSFIDKSTVFISEEAVIEENVTIMPFVVITGKSVIKKGCTVYSFSVIENSVVYENCTIGPNARLRPDSIIEKGCKIGNFVEIKNSRIGENSRAAHLAYVGDAVVGKNCNIGCGVVFCNFDGEKKHKTSVGNNCFIGSNVNLVAPITVGNGSFIAAGTTVTKNVPENSFVVGERITKMKTNHRLIV